MNLDGKQLVVLSRNRIEFIYRQNSSHISHAAQCLIFYSHSNLKV